MIYTGNKSVVVRLTFWENMCEEKHSKCQKFMWPYAGVHSKHKKREVARDMSSFSA